MSSKNSNKKSLKRPNEEALAKQQQIQDDMIASDIMSKLQMGVSELEVFADLVEQQVPMDEIQNAFTKLGVDQQGFNDLVDSYEEAMKGNQTQQQDMPDYAMLPEMQYGGSMYFPFNISQGNRMKGSDYIPAVGTYLPEDLGNRGNVFGALSTLAEGAVDLFGTGIDPKTGLMTGAFRDKKAKKRAHKRNKANEFVYKDSIGNPIDTTGYTNEELYKASKDPSYTPQKQIDLAKEYSRIGGNEEEGLKLFITDRPFDKRDYTKSKDSPYNRNLMEETYNSMTPVKDFDITPYLETKKKGGDLPKYQGLERIGETKEDEYPGPYADYPTYESVNRAQPNYDSDDQMLYSEQELVGVNPLTGKPLNFSIISPPPVMGSSNANVSGTNSTSNTNSTANNTSTNTNTTNITNTTNTNTTNADGNCINCKKPTGSKAKPAVSSPAVSSFKSNTRPVVDALPNRPLFDTEAFLQEQDEFFMDSFNDLEAGSIQADRRPGSRMRRFLSSPGVDKFSSVANFGVAGAGVANEMFQNKRALDAERELNMRTADDIYGTYEEREGDRGMYDVNTGLAQIDNLDIGYAMHGMEVPMMNTGMPKLDMNQEIDLDMETITKLIAAGADIEIL